MLNSLINILPITLVFLSGYILKKTKLFSSEDGSTLLKVVLYAASPALIFLSIINSEIDSSFIQFALFPLLIVGTTLIALIILRKIFATNIDIKTYGAMLIGAIIMNVGFVLPFVEKAYGQEGIVRLEIIELGNIVVIFTFVYAIAVNLGSKKFDSNYVTKKLLMSPPIWALVIALIIKFSNVATPKIIEEFCELLAKIVSPIMLLALGLKFQPKLNKLNILIIGLIGRFLIGGLIGIFFVEIFNISGLNAIIIILASTAPMGIMSITFADLENLDSEYAATQVSIGIITGMILIPILIALLNQVYL